MAKQSDIRIVSIDVEIKSFVAREPLKFGAVVVEDGKFGLVTATVENRRGQRGVGHGGMFIMDFWAFPNPGVPHPVCEEAMVDLTKRYCAAAAGYKDFGHPIDMVLELEKLLEPLARAVASDCGLPIPLPRLAHLVSASPLDAALHDAFGIANGISCYDGYGPDFVNNDLSAYLGPDFAGKHISQYIRPAFQASIPVFHLVGGLDTIWEKDVPADALADGLPHSLEKWIERDGLVCLKVKLRGTNLDWDLDRTIQTYRCAQEVQPRVGIHELHMSADTNEQCETPDYIVEYLKRLAELCPEAYKAILYIEQPTGRDLRGTRFDMRPIAAMKPVIIDESLASLEDFDIAMETGWSGVALKACKGQSWALIFASRARELGIPYTIQDLTCPHIALLQSAGLAGRLYPMMGVEANSPQYFPASNAWCARVHPELFERKNGRISLASLTGPGLGLHWDEMAAAD